jgi:hypothetical protein
MCLREREKEREEKLLRAALPGLGDVIKLLPTGTVFLYQFCSPIFSMLWPLPLLQQVSHRFSCRWVRFGLLLFYIHRQLRALTLLKKNLLRGCNTQGSLAPAPFRACRRHKSVQEREPVARKTFRNQTLFMLFWR